MNHAASERDACAATIRGYADQEADADQHGRDCQTRIGDAREVLRTTLPLPFWRWGRIRRAQREIITTNAQHADHWTDEQTRAGENRAYAESRLPTYLAAVDQAERRRADGERIITAIRAAWEELTPAQRAMVQQEAEARRMRSREQAQERAEDERRRQRQDMAHRPAYEPYQLQLEPPKPRPRFIL